MGYEYLKNHYKLIAVNLSKQEELDADPKAIQQIEFIWRLLNKSNQIIASESIFVLTILEKNQSNKIKILSRKCSSLLKDGEF